MSAEEVPVADDADAADDVDNTPDDHEERLVRLEQGFDILRSRVEELQADRDELRETVEEQQETIADLQGELADLRGRVDPDPRTKAYDQLTRGEKVRTLRLELLERAVNAGLDGYRMTYGEVQSGVFAENGSPGHMYQLMRLAAGLEARDADARGSSFPGYYFGTNEAGEYVIRVVVDEVADDGLVHAVNADPGSDGGVHTVNNAPTEGEG